MRTRLDSTVLPGPTAGIISSIVEIAGSVGLGLNLKPAEAKERKGVARGWWSGIVPSPVVPAVSLRSALQLGHAFQERSLQGVVAAATRILRR